MPMSSGWAAPMSSWSMPADWTSMSGGWVMPMGSWSSMGGKIFFIKTNFRSSFSDAIFVRIKIQLGIPCGARKSKFQLLDLQKKR